MWNRASLASNAKNERGPLWFASISRFGFGDDGNTAGIYRRAAAHVQPEREPSLATLLRTCSRKGILGEPARSPFPRSSRS